MMTLKDGQDVAVPAGAYRASTVMTGTLTYPQAKNVINYFYDSEKTHAHFASQRTELERAEHALKKAALGTDLKLPAPSISDPLRVISHFLDDKLVFSIGSHSREELYALFGKSAKSVAVQTVSHSAYLQASIDDIPHAALMTKDKVDVYCPTKEMEQVKEQMGVKSNSFHHSNLDLKIEKAREMCSTTAKFQVHQQQEMHR